MLFWGPWESGNKIQTADVRFRSLATDSNQHTVFEGPESKIKVADVLWAALGLWQQNPDSRRSFGSLAKEPKQQTVLSRRSFGGLGTLATKSGEQMFVLGV